MIAILAALRRNPAASVLAVLLLAAVAGVGWYWVQVQSLQSALESSRAESSELRAERDQLRAIVQRNREAVAALRAEREAIDADFAALREQIENADDDESCLDAINRAISQ